MSIFFRSSSSRSSRFCLSSSRRCLWPCYIQTLQLVITKNAVKLWQTHSFHKISRGISCPNTVYLFYIPHPHKYLHLHSACNPLTPDPHYYNLFHTGLLHTCCLICAVCTHKSSLTSTNASPSTAKVKYYRGVSLLCFQPGCFTRFITCVYFSTFFNTVCFIVSIFLSTACTFVMCFNKYQSNNQSINQSTLLCVQSAQCTKSPLTLQQQTPFHHPEHTAPLSANHNFVWIQTHFQTFTFPSIAPLIKPFN